MPRITASAPVLLVSDVVASANYFRDAAGFTYEGFHGDPPCFCICRRDGHYLMLAQTDASKITPFWKIRENTWNAYFWVDAADALYAEMKAARRTDGLRPVHAAVRRARVRHPGPRRPRHRLRPGLRVADGAPLDVRP